MVSSARFHALKFAPLLLVGFVYAITVAPPGIYNAEFLLSRGFSKETAGFVFTFSAAISIAFLAVMPLLLQRLGARCMLLGAITLLTIASLCLALSTSPTSTAIFFLFFVSVQIAVYSLVDILIEQKIDGVENVTGRARGLYLMAVNAAFTLGPLIAGFIIARFSFSHLYLFSAILSSAFLILMHFITRGFKDPHYPHVTIPYLIRSIVKDKAAATILTVNFLLQLRYAIVVVYLAIYLHEILGFSIGNVGLVISIASIPFMLVEFPLGWLGDRWLGERELLVVGFLMTCTGGALLSFTPSPSMVTMIGILALTFTGAAVIEVMSESYFFKHIKGKDDAHIMALRMLNPLAYFLAPFFAGAVMIFLPLNYVFASIAAICLLGIPLSLSLKDTR